MFLVLNGRTYYIHPREVWDANRCEKVVKHVAKDGLGTPYPWGGYVGDFRSGMGGYGRIRFNGGCIHEDQWFDGDIRPLPKVAKGFKIISIPAWGYRIIKC